MTLADERAVLSVGVAFYDDEHKGDIAISFGSTTYFLQPIQARHLHRLLTETLVTVHSDDFFSTEKDQIEVEAQ